MRRIFPALATISKSIAIFWCSAAKRTLRPETQFEVVTSFILKMMKERHCQSFTEKMSFREKRVKSSALARVSRVADKKCHAVKIKFTFIIIEWKVASSLLRIVGLICLARSLIKILQVCIVVNVKLYRAIPLIATVSKQNFRRFFSRFNRDGFKRRKGESTSQKGCKVIRQPTRKWQGSQ